MPGIFDALLSPVFGVVNTVVDRLVPDKNAAEKLKGEMQQALMEAQIKGELAQLDVNKAEAANSNFFVAGWRPSVGWVCSAALAYQFVVAPVGMWFAGIIGHPIPPPPMLDEMLWQLMFGMLGMGSLRTFEKVRGVA